jgi:flagellin
VLLPNTRSDKLARDINNESGFKSLREVDLTSFQGAQDALLMIDKAINEITSIRADLGAVQKNALESNITSLSIAKENLINAESVIRDTDMASEMSQFTKYQIMTQAATAMLAQANQAPNNVLSLLQ